MLSFSNTDWLGSGHEDVIATIYKKVTKIGPWESMKVKHDFGMIRAS